jgi:hypothetical protein
VALIAAFLGGAGFALSYGLDVRELATESNGWPLTPGVVLTAEVVAEARRGGGAYEPTVTYSYTVAGTPYVANVLRSGGFDFGSRANAEAKLAQYPVGSRVDVRYDPDDPGRAVLETGGSGWWGFLAAGLFAAIGGGYLLIDLVRDARLALGRTIGSRGKRGSA